MKKLSLFLLSAFFSATIGAFGLSGGSTGLSGFPASWDFTALSVGGVDVATLGHNTFTSPQSISYTSPTVIFNESDESADNKNWDFQANTKSFKGRVLNDAQSTASSWLQVDRTGTTIDTVNFPNGILRYGGTEIATRGTNTFTGNQTISTAGGGSQLFINSPSGFNSNLWFRENGVNETVLYESESDGAFRIQKYAVNGSTVAATVTLRQSGDIDLGGGPLRLNTVEIPTVSSASTLSNKIHTSPVINTSISGTAILDEDNMVSNSATKIATQQSIKAYVDSKDKIFVTNTSGGPYITNDTLDIGSVIGSAFEGVGPTGSGETNIWSALNSIPNDVSWIEVRLGGSFSNGAASTDLYGRVYARRQGSILAPSVGTLIMETGDHSDTSGHAKAYAATVHKIPVSGRVFDLAFSTNFTSYAVDMYLVGYGKN